MSKNTVASHFGKSCLFDLTLSQAFSNNKNDTTSKMNNSAERSGMRTARDKVSSKQTSHRVPAIRSSHNSQNMQGRPSAVSRELERVDVDDYWAKWLEFKENN